MMAKRVQRNSGIDPTVGDPRELLRAWLLGPSFTCLGARASLNQGSLSTVVLDDMNSASDAKALHSELARFVAEQLDQDEHFATLVAIFPGTPSMSEEQFEGNLWQMLENVHKVDRARHPWAADASSDVEDADFGFSVAEHSFFVVGMHDGSSRIARRFAYPAVAFNSSRQFASLKSTGAYTGLQAKIRSREFRLQGSINPNLAPFERFSETRQYAGRKTAESWVCPSEFGAT